MSNKKIIKSYGKCEVTINFSEVNPDSLEKVKWLIIESYCDRVKCSLCGEPADLKEESKAS